MTGESNSTPRLGSADPLPTLAEFLQTAPPGHMDDVAAVVAWSQRGQWELTLPTLTLYCESEECDRSSFFDPVSSYTVMESSNTQKPINALKFLHFTCRYCERSRKVFAVRMATKGGAVESISVGKFGEAPPAIGPTPRSLKVMLGEQWELFLQGRRSEIAGLGIGAFVYYRRAVEHVWQNVLARLIDVAKIEGNAERLAALTIAQQEPTFTRSMEAAKGAVPTSLYIEGHNPFQALYDACGDGLHEYSDDDCIKRSRMIRLVLGRFADRVKAVLSEDKEFRQALGSLTNGKG